MLECVEVDLAVGEGVVGGYVVGELDDLEVDALGLQRLLRGLPDVVIDGADDAELDGDGVAVGGGAVILGAAAGQGQGQQRDGQRQRKNSPAFHVIFLL